MRSALIPTEHGYPTFAPGGTIGAPEVRLSGSSRTTDNSLQDSKRPQEIETELSHDVLNPARVPL